MNKLEIKRKIFLLLKKIDEARFELQELGDEMIEYAEEIYVPDTESEYAQKQQERYDWFNDLGYDLSWDEIGLTNAIEQVCEYLEIDLQDLCEYEKLPR